MILIAAGLEKTDLGEMLKSLNELKGEEDLSIYSELRSTDLNDPLSLLKKNGRYNATILQFRKYISQFGVEQYQEAWVQAQSILTWFEKNNVAQVYAFPYELPASVLEKNIDLVGFKVKLLKESDYIPLSTLFFLKAMQEGGLLLNIDELDGNVSSLNIINQHSVTDHQGKLVGRVTLVEIGEGKRERVPHTIQHVDRNMAVLQVNIDDQTPEIIAYVMEMLLEAGANDVFSQLIVMKKGRSATMLNVLCDRATIPKMEGIIFKETTTFGIRQIPVIVHRLARAFEEVETPWGTVHVKIAKQEGENTQVSPEFEDCKKVAHMHNVPIKKVYEWVISQFN